MKLKKKMALNSSRTEKITLSGDKAMLLDDYAHYYFETYQEKILTSDLIVEMISVFIKSDRDFIKWTRNRCEKSETEVVHG